MNHLLKHIFHSSLKVWVDHLEGAPPPTKVRRARSVGKQMWAIFFRSSGFVAAVPLEDRKTVTADWYTTVCLPKVITSIDSQREKTGVRGILLHHDNASSHTALRTREFLENSGLKTLPSSTLQSRPSPLRLLVVL